MKERECWLLAVSRILLILACFEAQHPSFSTHFSNHPTCHSDGFRERTAGVAARAALPAPAELRGLPLGGRMDPGEIPTLQQLGLAPLPKGTAAAGSSSGGGSSGSGQAKGGEGEALSQLRRFLAHAAGGSGGSGKAVAAGAAYTSNFASCIAPWLATGCLSPRRMLEEAQQALGGGSSSAQAPAPAAAAQPATAAAGSAAQAPLSWVRYELLWRDFFRFITLKYSSVSTAALGAKAGAAAAAAAPAQPALAVA